MISSVNQIVFFNGFLSDFVEITPSVVNTGLNRIFFYLDFIIIRDFC